jgi:DNA-nicking Smr family endonuclease
MRRARTLSTADLETWAGFARHIRLLPGHRLTATPDAPPPATTAAEAPPAAHPNPRAKTPPHILPAVVTGVAPPGLDRGSWNRFSGGKLRVDRSLDLHGRTVHAAHHALIDFLHTAHTDRLRCVEIITGRGSGETGGAIRRELPHWLNAPSIRPMILAASHPHVNNPGATRVLLRRRGR